MVDITDAEDIHEIAANPRRLRRATDTTVEYGDGDRGGYTHLNSSINLNACAIGLGLENVEYDPEAFAGLVYRLDNPDVTVVVTAVGQFVVVDAASEQTAREGVIKAVSSISQLGLYDGDVPDESDVTTSRTR